jgi:putative membrane protein
MKFILRWAINTVALYVAIILLPSYIILHGSWINIIWLALIFGLVNAILRPPFKALSSDQHPAVWPDLLGWQRG